MTLKTFLLLTILLVIPLKAISQNRFISPEESERLAGAIVPLGDRILLSDDVRAELNSLYKKCEGKEIIAIGEATHGTDEIRQFQLLITEKLIQDKGFKAIALGETPLLGSYPLFEYAVYGHGNLNLLSNKFHFDIGPLLSRIRKYNHLLPDSVKVWITGTATDSPESTLDFIEAHCKLHPINAAHFPLAAIRKALMFDGNMSTATIRMHADSLISALKTFSNTDSLRIKNRFMEKAILAVTQNWEQRNNTLKTFQYRDLFIFTMLTDIHRTKGKTVIILSHNLHINRKTLTEDIYTETSRSFGEYLSDAFKENYLSLATEVDRGSFSGIGQKKVAVPVSDRKLGTVLGSLTPASFALLFPDHATKTILNHPDWQITKGTSQGYLVEGRGLLGTAFDGFIFIRTSNPYTYYNNDDFCTLYVHLNDLKVAEIIRSGHLSVTSQTLSDPDRQSHYSVYLHDRHQKMISHNQHSFAPGLSSFSVRVPDSTHYISVSLILKNPKNFRLQELQINDSIIPFKHLTLHDWNKKGYKTVKHKNETIITRKPDQ